MPTRTTLLLPALSLERCLEMGDGIKFGGGRGVYDEVSALVRAGLCEKESRLLPYELIDFAAVQRLAEEENDL